MAPTDPTYLGHVIDSPRLGDDVVFFPSNKTDGYFLARVTRVLKANRVHLHVSEPNGLLIRKNVSLAKEGDVRYRWLPLGLALEVHPTK